MNLYTQYAQCTACRLHATRRHVVIGRGVIPADLLFVGEAPGMSEDLRAEAFIGRAGRVLNEAIRRSKTFCGVSAPRYYITNVVACRPTDVRGDRNREPQDDEIVACRARLRDTVLAVKARRVVLLGKIAQVHARDLCPGAVNMTHPAAFLHEYGDGWRRSPAFKKFVRELTDLFEDMTVRRVART